MAAAFRAASSRPIIPFITEAASWCDGLNAAWQAHPDADVLFCGADDIEPRGEWLTPALDALEDGLPTYTIVEPSITHRPEGVPPYPVLKREWFGAVFPLPQGLHYYGDNEITDRLRAIGISAVPCDAVIVHHADQRGRKTTNDDKYRYQELKSITESVQSA